MSTDTITEDRVITIDYSKSLQEMIAAGKYDWINNNITAANFPVEGTSIVQFEPKIFHFFDRYISSEDAVAAIKADDREIPWEPAKIKCLLAYGAKNPDEQREYPIIGLGSCVEIGRERSVPCLDRRGAGRSLRIRGWDGGWIDDCRFLAVRKLSSAA